MTIEFLLGSSLVALETLLPLNLFRKIDTTLSSGFYVKTATPEDSTYNFSATSKLSFRDFDFKAAYKIQTEKFGEEVEADDLDNFSCSAAFRLKDLVNVPISVMFGKLNFSGSVSKMNSPQLSSSLSCFGYTPSSASGINASLSTVSSYSKPTAFTFFYDYYAKNRLATSAKTSRTALQKSSVHFFADDTGNFAESAIFSFRVNKKATLSFSETLGYYFIENTSASWFSSTCLFPKSQYLFGNLQLAFQSPFYSSRFIANFYELDSSHIKWTASLENELKAGLFGVAFSGFFASSPEIFTPSSKNQKTLSQIKINPFITFFPKNRLRFRLGVLYYMEEKADSDLESTFFHKGSIGANLTNKNLYTKLQFSLTKTKYTSYFYMSFKKKLKPTFSVQHAFFPKEANEKDFHENELKASIGISVPTKNALAFGIKLYSTVDFAPDFDNATTTLSFSIKHRTKFSNLSCAVSVKCKME